MTGPSSKPRDAADGAVQHVGRGRAVVSTDKVTVSATVMSLTDSSTPSCFEDFGDGAVWSDRGRLPLEMRLAGRMNVFGTFPASTPTSRNRGKLVLASRRHSELQSSRARGACLDHVAYLSAAKQCPGDRNQHLRLWSPRHARRRLSSRSSSVRRPRHEADRWVVQRRHRLPRHVPSRYDDTYRASALLHRSAAAALVQRRLPPRITLGHRVLSTTSLWRRSISLKPRQPMGHGRFSPTWQDSLGSRFLLAVSL